MGTVTIQRKGSFLYARAYLKIAAIITVVYTVVSVILALISARLLDTYLAALVTLALLMGLLLTTWLVYAVVLWAFAREARQSVEIGPEGIREVRAGRERRFIPWEGVNEIEVVATVIAGASVRVKGRFSEIAISNVDITITRRMTISEMHVAMGQTKAIRQLLKEIKAAAPNAALRTNSLARRGKATDAWIGSDAS
ncbi:MAG TPA: hypothetical protein VE262_25160 [Blastocatellia bacterium]|nr:hypothetical protein [Blastocatellia bacterium]